MKRCQVQHLNPGLILTNSLNLNFRLKTENCHDLHFQVEWNLVHIVSTKWRCVWHVFCDTYTFMYPWIHSVCMCGGGVLQSSMTIICYREMWCEHNKSARQHTSDVCSCCQMSGHCTASCWTWSKYKSGLHSKLSDHYNAILWCEL